MKQRIIDTHVHVWDLAKASYPWLAGDTSPLNQSWEIETLEAERLKAGVTDGILVQAAGNAEDTDHMLQVAEGVDWIRGVVIWLPLLHPTEMTRTLNEKYITNPYVAGVRHQIHDEQDPRWLLQPPVVESLQLLADLAIPFDIVAVKPAHIETALKLAEKVPHLRMVFDHLCQPPIASGERFGYWGELMQAASAHKNFYAKISGLGTASGNPGAWSKNDLLPYIEFVLQHFGPQRCFCGGDWPVSTLAGSYSRTWQAYLDIISSLLPPQQQEQVLCGSALEFYKLKTPEKISQAWKS